jgi:hypothetical protein
VLWGHYQLPPLSNALLVITAKVLAEACFPESAIIVYKISVPLYLFCICHGIIKEYNFKDKDIYPEYLKIKTFFPEICLEEQILALMTALRYKGG